LNFYSYRLKVEKKDKDFVFNGNKIETISIWNYSLQKNLMSERRCKDGN